MAYAEGTSVPVERSRAEIERLVTKYGADKFVSGWSSKGDASAMIQFNAHGRYVKIVMRMPDRKEARFVRKSGSSWSNRTAIQQEAAYESEVRRLWRALLLVVKSKLESVSSGIETFEEAFLPWIMLPDGSTVGHAVAPLIEEAYASGRLPSQLALPAPDPERKP